MYNSIRVSSHQFNKDEATAEVNRILGHRRERINGYFKKYNELKDKFEEAQKKFIAKKKEFDQAEDELKEAKNAGDSVEALKKFNDFKSKEQPMLDTLAENARNAKATMEGEFLIARQRRSKYRVSSRAAFSSYECIGKGGRNGEWVFTIKEVRYA